MKNRNRLQNWMKKTMGICALLAVLVAGICYDSFVSLADSTGKITATSAKVRKEASTTSDTVGSVTQGTTLSVAGQTTGADGFTWYKVTISGGVVGYIRSDLMEITAGTTANVVTPTTGTTTTAPVADEELVDVAEVVPVSAKVSGTNKVNVRQNASVTSRIVASAQNGMALTVVGQATGTNQKQWYQVNFNSNGSEISGFISAEYVTVEGDLKAPESQTDSQAGSESTAPETTEPAETGDEWEVFYTADDNKWHLKNNVTGASYDIAQIFSANEANTKTLESVLKENKTQQVVVIILIIVIIALGAGVTFLFFKLKDMTDSAYFNEVEQETMRRRTADRPVSKPQSGQKVMQTVGADGNKRPASQGQRPASQGQRPAGQGQRPVGQGQRPAGQASQRAAGQRPAGQAPQRAAGQRPAGQAPQRAAGQRPVGAQAPVQRPVVPTEENAQGMIQEELAGMQEELVKDTVVQAENAGWQAKNFVNEDEFEFQFLDWNEEEK